VRPLRIRFLIMGLSTALFLLTADGPDEVAHGQGATNNAVTNAPTTNPRPVLPRPLSRVQSNRIPIDAETAVSNSTEEIAEIPSEEPETNPSAAVNPPAPSAPVSPAPVPPAAPARVAEPPETATIDFEFQGAPISAILEWYARLTNRSIISAPNLAGVINFRSQTKLTRTDALQALDSVLAINNIAAIPLGDKFLKVVQITSAKTEGLPFGRAMVPADTLGTQIIPLKFAEATEVVTVLQPYLHPYGQLVALQKSNSILISETAANIKQMMEIVDYVDQPSTLRMEMRSFVLAHAKASDVMARLQAIIQETEQAGARAAVPGQPGQPAQPAGLVIRRPATPGQPGAPAGEESVVEGKVIMAADERTNKIFILTRPSNFGFFDRLIAELDAKVEPDVVMKVIELNYAAAEDVASLINSLITGSAAAAPAHHTSGGSSSTTSGARPPSIPPPPVSGGSGGNATDTGFLQYAEGVRILPDPRTNSLLVMATKEDMQRIMDLVKSIDTSVAQVQIEVVIAEVTLNNELDVGVDLFSRLSRAGQVSGTGGNSTDGNTPVQLSPLSAIGSNLPTAAALAGGAGGLTYFTTFRNLNLDTVIHALASTANSKVLSTPVIQTMDNQEADILVGESVPVPTSQSSSLISGVGTLATAGVTSSIQYEDVAIELKVTPRINPDGYVRMDVEQKVNDLGANVNIGGTIVPTILKREAKSSLAVEDKSTIVLGGLIQQTKSLSTTKTPFLGDIPFFGQLFKSQQNNKQRTELIIFIRPTVLRTDAAAVNEARRRLKMLGVSEELEQRYFPGAISPTNTVPASAQSRNEPTPGYRTTIVQPQPPVAVQPVPPVTVQSPPPVSGQRQPPVFVQPQSAVEDPTDRQSTKVKALKLEDGDITAQ
jgi:general secretion pathway protein D